MIKLVFNIRRRSDIEPAEFYRYWKDEHGPLVRSVAETLGIVRYVQSHTIDTPLNDLLRASRDTEPRYDGVAELWWASMDDFVAGSSSPDGQAAAAALLEDERRFIDLPATSIFLAEEHEIIPG
ncbi:MAG: EthD domain-containing protein [Acidimicrobiales bacterium]